MVITYNLFSRKGDFNESVKSRQLSSKVGEASQLEAERLVTITSAVRDRNDGGLTIACKRAAVEHTEVAASACATAGSWITAAAAVWDGIGSEAAASCSLSAVQADAGSVPQPPRF